LGSPRPAFSDFCHPDWSAAPFAARSEGTTQKLDEKSDPILSNHFLSKIENHSLLS
jgi:hypothetical protein